MIERVRSNRTIEVRRFYHRNRPNAVGLIRPEVSYDSRSFVERDDDGGITGYVLVSFFEYGLGVHGVIHELEIDRGAKDPYRIGRRLVDACLAWLAQRAVLLAEVVIRNPEDGEFYRCLGFEPSSRGLSQWVPYERVLLTRQVQG